MQKLFIIRNDGNNNWADQVIDKINAFIGTTGKIISITPNNVHGFPNQSSSGYWLVVAEKNVVEL